MELSATYRSLYGLRYCPVTLIQTVFSAGTVYLLTAIQAGSGIRIAQKDLAHSLDQQKLVMTYLHEIGRSWQGATSIAGILKGLMEEQVKPILERKPIMLNPSSGLIAPDYGDNDDSDENSLSTGHPRPSGLSLSLRRHGSTSKAVGQRRLGHSRTHSVSQSTPPPSATPPSQVSNSPTITISPVQQSFLTHNKSSSLPSASVSAGSSPIAIKGSPRASNSLFSSSPSNLSDHWGRRPGSVHNGSPSPSTSPAFSPIFSCSPSAASASFINRPGSFQAHSPLSSFTTVDESSFFTESVPINHAFQGQGNFFVPVHGFANASGLSSAYQYPGKELAGVLGMLGGQTLPQAPYIGPFSLTDPVAELSSPEDLFASSSYSTYDNTTYINQASTSYIDSPSMVDNDTNMDDMGGQLEFWSQTTFDS